jgi:hypothetical protein
MEAPSGEKSQKSTYYTIAWFEFSKIFPPMEVPPG